MNLPFFYSENIAASGSTFVFDEETSKHIVQVLRMKRGELLQVTDGKGHLLKGEIINDHKKKCEVKAVDLQYITYSTGKIAIAISLLKNVSRFEWFLEKATEIGIHKIIPLICDRTEKQHIRHERLKNICTSAMLQSQQVWMPDLQQPIPFTSLFEKFQYDQKFIAYCIGDERQKLAEHVRSEPGSKIILIGPEGDFTNDEAAMAVKHNCIPVSLGETRLRTETAGIVAASILKIR